MMSRAKVKNHDVLAQEWFYDLLPRPRHEHKSGA